MFPLPLKILAEFFLQFQVFFTFYYNYFLCLIGKFVLKSNHLLTLRCLLCEVLLRTLILKEDALIRSKIKARKREEVGIRIFALYHTESSVTERFYINTSGTKSFMSQRLFVVSNIRFWTRRCAHYRQSVRNSATHEGHSNLYNGQANNPLSCDSICTSIPLWMLNVLMRDTLRNEPCAIRGP